MKEEERIERIIRGLLKQPDNRRCINCNSLGPQYVCTTFWTFICTNCSGIHREFTHRVKSVSMAKFTADEVSSLQAGGNERVRQTFFKTWDPSRNFCPDGSNLNKLREFIRAVYVDRRFTGDRIQENRPSNVKLGSKDVYDDRRSFERTTPTAREEFVERHSFERSAPTAREAFVERHSFESSSLADRRSYEKFSRGVRDELHGRWSIEKYTSPRKSNERSLRYCIDQVRSPVTPVRQKSRSARFEIVDDRFREDGPRNVKKYEHYSFSKTESKRGSRSPDARRVRSEQSPPVMSPVKAISGDKAPELKVSEPPTPKSKARKETDGSAKAEKTGVSKNSSGSSANAKPSQNEVVQPVSLIDFDTDPQSLALTLTTQPIASSPETSGTTSSNDKVSPVDTLEALLFGLSPSVETTENKALVPYVNDANPGITPPARDAAQTEILALPAPEGFEAKVQNVQQLHSMQSFPSRINSLTPQQSTALVLYNQRSNSEPLPNYGEGAAFSNTSQQSSQPASTPAWDASSGNDLRSSGRRELPAELFTSSYAPFAAASSPWQFHPPHGMGYGMQYYPYPTMMVSTKSRNPFDDDSPQVPAPMFHSMSLPLQGQPPNMSPSPPFPYSMASPQLASSYGMTMPAGAYVGQQLNDNMLNPRHQRSHSDETGESAFASMNPLHQSSSGITYQMPNASNPPLSRGNPFS
ncbi:probable ADP-ribosylation factor GTPase-activating protein AGD14 isoform X1 [Ipomoea triloba]|uniref:probable ADP-ribosylation factor GTPase-activating protein AGD14 isoform X1 n=1 Tax=Ipomoea triloba TaxID=35885 RepID=UPI00125D407F|nr:probable ADP-ribosylation factor GTPase-activating protein AGD14 isoform X1 [Ipomoea triloba]XP_031102552.1 probable ADP-ribosylation factor GTPase-activating protein AGD14 isoform X1 [Ipomoea triloba]XP_031102553.1 probable ADP-ribosylation factor GTPase-activating protein AGD14 isoform X1 [Ipomoea triloba]